MKKTYEKPALHTEAFDVEDVVTVSSGPSPIQHALETVGGLMEQMVEMFGSLGQ